MFANCTNLTKLKLFDISSYKTGITMTRFFDDTPGAGNTLVITKFDGSRFSNADLQYLQSKTGDTALRLATDGTITKTG